MNAVVDYRLIGQRIHTYRKQAHLTQAELAECAGVCQQFVGRLERGKAIPSLATVMSLCAALSIDPNTLLLDCAKYDPEAPCTLRDIPSPWTNTLTSVMLNDVPADNATNVCWKPSMFPPYDITLKDSSGTID